MTDELDLIPYSQVKRLREPITFGAKPYDNTEGCRCYSVSDECAAKLGRRCKLEPRVDITRYAPGHAPNGSWRATADEVFAVLSFASSEYPIARAAQYYLPGKGQCPCHQCQQARADEQRAAQCAGCECCNAQGFEFCI